LRRFTQRVSNWWKVQEDFGMKDWRVLARPKDWRVAANLQSWHTSFGVSQVLSDGNI